MVEAQKAQRITFSGAKGFLVTENNKNQRKTNRTSSQKVVQCRKNLKTQIFCFYLCLEYGTGCISHFPLDNMKALAKLHKTPAKYREFFRILS